VKRKSAAHEHASHERWLVSYADFITLMFAFFVVLFASSQVDKKKVARVAASFQSYISHGAVRQEGVVNQGPRATDTPDASSQALKALSMAELAPVKDSLEKELTAEIAEGKISVSLEPRGLVLSLREAALFPAGRDSFTPEARPILGKLARSLANLPNQPVRLEGHTDNVPIQTSQFPSNWELSAARAMAVLDHLMREHQITPQRMAVAGYADFHPVASNASQEGRAQNRRVDIVVLSNTAAALEPRQKPDSTPPAAPGSN